MLTKDLAVGVVFVPRSLERELRRLLEGWLSVDLLYAKQDSFGLKSWTSFALDAGISDTARFNDCITKRPGARKIDSTAAQGQRMAVGGTPTVLIERWRYSQPPADSLLSIVKAAAAKQRD
jgi:protein-disulfide isomerase